MAQDSQHVRKSLNIKPQASPDLTDTGDMGVDSADSNRLQFNDGTGAQRVLLQVDADSGAFTDAANVDYSNTTSGLSAVTVQAAIDEVDSDLDTAEATLATTVTTLSSHVSATAAHGATGAVVGTTNTQTLTNKTLTSPIINSPTGIVKADVGLGNVDNTSDATKNAASVTLTNKTIDAPTIIGSITTSDANFTITGGATNRDINITAQGSGDINLTTGSGQVSLNGIEFNTTNQIIATASSDIEFRAKTGQNTKINAFTGFVLLQKDNVEQARIVSTGIQLASGKTLTSAGGGSIVMNTSGAMTMPSATDTVVGKATTDTLTNKTIAAGSNTISGLTDSNLSGSAGISIANGGTGAATKTAAFDALSPMTTSGDVIYGGTSGTGTRLAKGSDGQVLTLASGLPSWQTSASGNLSVTAVKTTTYAILTSDDLVLVSGASGSFTATLPTAVGVSGKQYRIKRTDQTLANIVTIGTTSSQTIDGVTTKTLATQYEEWTIASDGANWHVLAHTYPSVWTSYTPTFTGFGTTSVVNFYWRRTGDSISVRGAFTAGTPTAVEAQITYPSGLTSASSTKLSTGNMIAGRNNGNASSSVFFSGGTVIAQASVAYMAFGAETSTLNGVTRINGNAWVGVSQPLHVIANEIPITNWEG